ncbi:SLU7 [Symbiodinium pilosum]|uniref:SLU7 protein n=1 Tax=Symbiodinium pilosum TaxID=2952 RepID=A0A812J8Z1_SYMPI|nr:SLU7 [Symbiodinium pilosum]
MDPTLAARFARQKEKHEKGEEVAEIGSRANQTTQLDPVLAQRWEKLQTGKCAVEDDIGSKAERTVKLDPKLAKRWSQQQELVDSGLYEVEIGSTADQSTKLDPVLAKHWAAAHERSLAGKEYPDPEEAGPKVDFSRKDTELAKRFAKLQRQAQRNEGGEAKRCQLQFSAGEVKKHEVSWSRDGASRLQWSAVVLEDLTIDLEVCAVVRIPCAEEMTETIVLQRNARGGTFVGTLDARSDRRLLVRQGEEQFRREVISVVFKFSNSFSWFTGKEVELVFLQD